MLDIGVFGPYKAMYRKELNEVLFEKAKSNTKKVALNEGESVRLALKKWRLIPQSTIDSAFVKSKLKKFEYLGAIDRSWSIEDQENYALNNQYEEHLFEFYQVSLNKSL